MRWDQGRFAIERACTCKSKSPECAARGFHVVHSGQDALDLLKEATDLQREVGVPYRVIDQATSLVVS